MPNNDDRADRAAAAIYAYARHTGDRPDEAHFRDLLNDLMHLAARDGAGDYGCPRERDLTFDEALAIARRSFEDEGGTFLPVAPGYGFTVTEASDANRPAPSPAVQAVAKPPLTRPVIVHTEDKARGEFEFTASAQWVLDTYFGDNDGRFHDPDEETPMNLSYARETMEAGSILTFYDGEGDRYRVTPA